MSHPNTASTICQVSPVPLVGANAIAARGFTRVEKVVLAYSVGPDISAILHWPQATCRREAITFPADLCQGEELGPPQQKAEMLDVKEIFVDGLHETFVRAFVFPMLGADAFY
jgi:argininosuccinate synthase